MTITFRVNRISLDTVGGEVSYEFPSDLTVLAGSVGVGKSTLFELIKHGLGADALLADVVERSVLSVALDISIGASHFMLSRVTRGMYTDRIRVFDVGGQVQLEDHFASKQKPTLSSLLLSAMDLPDDMRAAARVGSTNQGARITFNDVLKYMYVSQADINKTIAGSGESYYQPKRKAVFELLFDLTNAETLEIKSELARVRGESSQAEHDYSVIAQFLADSNMLSRIDAEQAQVEAVRQHERALGLIAAIQDAASLAIDRETLTLRDLLGEAERGLTLAEDSRVMLQQQRTDFVRELLLLQQDVDRIGRMTLAGERIAEIEFTVCPRCLQSLKTRSIPAHACRLCLQADPVPPAGKDGGTTYELTQLKEQMAELKEQIRETDRQIQATADAVESRMALIFELSKSIDERTRERITPRFQAYADAVTQVAKADSLRRETEKTLQQWDRADDLRNHADELVGRLASLRSDLERAEEALRSRRNEVFDELDAEFSEIVSSIGIPGVSVAKIDRGTYLPILNGRSFDKFSPVGGVRTATQVAYRVALMTVALRRRDTHFPAFLLMDSPRTSLNDDDDLSAALYRRLVTLADAADGRLQVIVGDNELPADYRRDYEQIDFDYDHPTIRTVRHPGREAVTTIGGSVE